MSKTVYVLVYPDTRQLQNKSFDYKAWAGLSVIIDVLQRVGYNVDYCSAEDASGKVVLATVPSAPSWYSLVSAWQKAKPRGATLVIGGSGVLNVRPFLELDAVFVLGRGETLIADVVEAAFRGDWLDSPHVIYSRHFSVNSDYFVCQGEGNHPYTITLMNGKSWTENGQGCPFQCYFCNYTWTRTLPPRVTDYGRQISDRGAVVAGASNLAEHNLCDLMKAWRKGEPLCGGRMCNSSIDGQSERIRRAVKKPVTRRMLKDVGRIAPQNIRISLMTVVGFPGEDKVDRAEANADLIEGLEARFSLERWGIEISPNSFRPMPCTPLSWVSTQVKEWSRILPHEWGAGVGGHKQRLWSSQDGRVGLKMHWGVGGAAHQELDLIALRGTEEDWPNIVKISKSRKFWVAPASRRRATLESLFDMNKLAGSFDAETLPTRYLNGRFPNTEIWKLGQVAINQLVGGVC